MRYALSRRSLSRAHVRNLSNVNGWGLGGLVGGNLPDAFLGLPAPDSTNREGTAT
jgi:hypothetical protein